MKNWLRKSLTGLVTVSMLTGLFPVPTSAARITAQQIPGSVFADTTAKGMNVASNATLTPGTGSFGAMVWMKPSANPVGGTAQIFEYNSAAYASGFLLSNYDQNQLIAYASSSVGQLNSTINPLAKGGVGKWHLVGMTANATDGKLRIYVDGVNIATSGATAWNIAQSDFSIGGGAFGTTVGKFSEAYYWKGTIPTDAQVSDLYYNGYRAQGSPVARWKMNEMTGNPVDSISGLTATLVGSPTWSQEAPRRETQNGLLSTQDFSTSFWTRSGLNSVVPNSTTDPFGGTAGNKVIEDGTAATTHIFDQTPPVGLTSMPVTFSLFAKAGTRSWIAIYGRGGGAGSYFNSTDCSQGTAAGAAYITGGAETYPGGWCRFWVSYTNDGYPARVYMANANGGAVYSGDNTSYIYTYGAQFEKGVGMSPYRRVDAAPTELSARNTVAQTQNLITYSQQLENAAYSKPSVNISQDTDADPLGSMTLDRMTGTAINNAYVLQSFTGTIGKTYTLSAVVKAGTQSYVGIGDASACNAFFNLSTGQLDSKTGTAAAAATTNIVNLGGGLFSISVTMPIGNPRIVVYEGKNDGTSNGAYISAGWLQVTSGNLAGSYVPTTSLVFNEGAPRSATYPFLSSNNLLTDGDMETSTTSSWASFNSAVISKSTTGPRSGTRNLRVTYGAAGLWGTRQVVLTAGVKYRVRGWWRSDGNVAPVLMVGGNTNTLVGTVDTSWRPFDVTVAADGASLYIVASTGSAGQYFELDDMTVATLPNDQTRVNVAQQQNLVKYSQRFQNAPWASTDLTPLDNQLANPINGAQTATKLTEVATLNVHVLNYGTVTPYPRKTMTLSYFVKDGNRRYFLVRAGTSVGYEATFDLTAGTVTNTSGIDSAGIIPIGTTGWYRAWITFTPQDSTNLTLQVGLNNSSGGYGSYNGDVAKYLYIYNGQLVQANWPGAPTQTGTANVDYGPIRNIAY